MPGTIVSSFQDDGMNDNLRVLINIFCNQRQGLRVCHINAQSLFKKIDEFRALFVGSNVDVVCVTESWFKTGVMDETYALHGYRIFRGDRHNRIGGGVAIYIRNSLATKFLINSPPGNPLQYCFVEVVCERKKCLLGVVYRPNSYFDLTPIFNLLENYSPNYWKTIVCGDFNCNLLNYEGSESFVQSMKTLGLDIVNTTVPTHFTHASTLLDLFLSNDCQDVFYSQASAPAFSKHDLIFATFNFPRGELQSKYTYRDFRNINSDVLEQDMQRINWHPIYHGISTDTQVDLLQHIVLELFNTHVPLRTKTTHPYKSWFTPEIIDLKNKRDTAYKKWRKFKLQEFYNSFRQLRNLVNSKIKQAKRVFYDRHFDHKLPSKTLWQNLRELGVGRKKNAEMNDIDPNQLNREFTKVQMTSSTSADPVDSTLSGFEFACIEQADVVNAILKIKSKAVGIDGIHPIFIKIILPYILPAITHIFNNIIVTSTFPTAWKIAKILPALKKKASSNSPAEYRPIAILPFLSKVMEKIIHKQMSVFIQRNKLLCTNQSGFRPYHSCTSALLKVTDDIRVAMDKDLITFVTLLDFSKAFDTVDHTQLLLKLKRLFGFSSPAIKLIKTYLGGRKQAVAVNNAMSDLIATSAGVPQGSILGPLLFTIFINDLPTIIKYSSLHMYADDVQLYISCKLDLIKDAACKLNEDLRKILDWSEVNSLKLNPAKSKCLVISRNGMNGCDIPNIFLRNEPIELVDKAKNLGVWFNKTLSWDDHISTIIGKVYGSLRNLSMSQCFTPLHTRLMLVRALLTPIFTYACEIFCCSSAFIRRKLNVAFNNITRYVYGLRRFDHVSEYTKNILGCTLDKYLEYCTIKYLHKIITSKQPPYLFEKLKISRSTRSLSLIQPRVSYQNSERQFFVHAIRLWNALPLRVRRLYNANNFGETLFRFLAG